MLYSLSLCILLPALQGLTQEEMASHLLMIEVLRAFLMRLASDKRLTEAGGNNQHSQEESCVLKQFWGFIGIVLQVIKYRYVCTRRFHSSSHAFPATSCVRGAFL